MAPISPLNSPNLYLCLHIYSLLSHLFSAVSPKNEVLNDITEIALQVLGFLSNEFFSLPSSIPDAQKQVLHRSFAVACDRNVVNVDQGIVDYMMKLFHALLPSSTEPVQTTQPRGLVVRSNNANGSASSAFGQTSALSPRPLLPPGLSPAANVVTNGGVGHDLLDLGARDHVAAGDLLGLSTRKKDEERPNRVTAFPSIPCEDDDDDESTVSSASSGKSRYRYETLYVL